MVDRGENGFSTLEVVVALVIFSVALLPLMSVQMNVFQTSAQLEARNLLTTAEVQALAYIKTVNVGANPESQYDFGDIQLSWRAKLVDEDAEFVQTLPDRIRRIGLYEVQLSISAGPPNRSEKTIRAVGWIDQEQIG